MLNEKTETQLRWFSRSELEARILEHVAEGWRVLFTVPIPLPPMPVQQLQPILATNQYINANSGAVFSFQVPASPPIQGAPMIEVCFYRKKWEQDPCPKCSYPYPDPERIDREV